MVAIKLTTTLCHLILQKHKYNKYNLKEHKNATLVTDSKYAKAHILHSHSVRASWNRQLIDHFAVWIYIEGIFFIHLLIVC